MYSAGASFSRRRWCERPPSCRPDPRKPRPLRSRAVRRPSSGPSRRRSCARRPPRPHSTSAGVSPMTTTSGPWTVTPSSSRARRCATAGSSPRSSWSEPYAPTRNRPGSMPPARSFARAPGCEIPRDQPEHDVRSRLERVEQFSDARHQANRRRRLVELFVQEVDVAIEQERHARVDVIVGVSLDPHQLADDLRIRLSVEAMLDSVPARRTPRRARDARRASPLRSVSRMVPSMSNRTSFTFA